MLKSRMTVRAGGRGGSDSCGRRVWGDQETVLATLEEWMADPSVKHNATVLLVAGVVYSNEDNYVEALKALHGAGTLEK